MTELEQALVALGRELDIPAAPDVSHAVRARIETRGRRRRALALALAVIVVGVGIAFAVPQARSAILRFFHLGAATVERVETLPPAQERSPVAGLGPGRSRAAAERIAGFRMQLPAFERGAPSQYYARPGVIAVTFRLGKPVLLMELNGRQLGLTKKYVLGKTKVVPVNVSDTYFGLWIEGAPHVLVYATPSGMQRNATTRLAGNVLLWEAFGLTFRLEGDLSRDEALRLARKITP
jgi:hypothetical protein